MRIFDTFVSILAVRGAAAATLEQAYTLKSTSDADSAELSGSGISSATGQVLVDQPVSSARAVDQDTTSSVSSSCWRSCLGEPASALPAAETDITETVIETTTLKSSSTPKVRLTSTLHLTRSKSKSSASSIETRGPMLSARDLAQSNFTGAVSSSCWRSCLGEPASALPASEVDVTETVVVKTTLKSHSTSTKHESGTETEQPVLSARELAQTPCGGSIPEPAKVVDIDITETVTVSVTNTDASSTSTIRVTSSYKVVKATKSASSISTKKSVETKTPLQRAILSAGGEKLQGEMDRETRLNIARTADQRPSKKSKSKKSTSTMPEETPQTEIVTVTKYDDDKPTSRSTATTEVTETEVVTKTEYVDDTPTSSSTSSRAISTSYTVETRVGTHKVTRTVSYSEPSFSVGTSTFLQTRTRTRHKTIKASTSKAAASISSSFSTRYVTRVRTRHRTISTSTINASIESSTSSAAPTVSTSSLVSSTSSNPNADLTATVYMTLSESDIQIISDTAKPTVSCTTITPASGGPHSTSSVVVWPREAVGSAAADESVQPTDWSRWLLTKTTESVPQGRAETSLSAEPSTLLTAIRLV